MNVSIMKLIAPLPLTASMLSSQMVYAQQEPVGQAPPEAINQPEVQAITEFGGVLTPRGQLVIEPSLQYSHAGVNRLTFQGIEILSTLLIGVFSAEEANRDTWTAAITGRLGVSDRLELEAKVPYVYRSDTLFATVPTVEGSEAGQFDIDRDLSGNGLGDIELAARYQLTSGRNNWPYLIGNLRYKTTTGDGPFDIRRDDDGIERELATGSGFHSIEPSITALYPSDPAVFFANLGYMYTRKDSINKRINDDITIGDVDPGDAIRVSFGMGYAINERASFSMGYKHDFIDSTKTEFIGANGNSTTQSSRSLNIGSLLLGWSYQLKPEVSVNLGLELGVTDDAPDTVITLRIPFGMGMY
ncbi:Putative MetA-pathway of phenol degradation [Franzmannia pantelleriensis]|uniref:Putative MetA-pathway of phenol degradation n=2 Tax=Franzmannia pantelleriensis TaxID=48727 RepID=A0A1G9L6Y9_9GAMM|nr:Putative MetA-pathway of phenol degradation [Halomonas pantelleriensis]